MVDVVVVGAGHAAALHVAAARAIPELRLRGAVVRSPERAPAAGRALETTGLVLEDVDADVDLAIVATPPTARLDVCATLAARGIAVLVEAPLSARADLDRLVEVTGNLLTPAANLVHAPLVAAMRERLDRRAVTHVGVTHRRPRPTWGGYPDGGWGAGVLYDLGVPAVQLATSMALARPHTVSATIDTAAGVDVAARLHVDLDGGAHVVVDVGWSDTDPHLDAQVATPTSALRVELQPGRLLEHNGDPQTVAPDSRTRRAAPALVDLGYIAQLEAVLAGTPAPIEPAVTASGIVVAAATSAALDRPVALAEVTDEHRSPAELLARR